MVGAVDQTTNFALNKPEFDYRLYHDLINDNWDVIDAILQQYIAVQNVVGVWANSTAYTIGQRVIDSTAGVIYNCDIAHTSPASPTTFLQSRTTNPTYWSSLSQAARSRGVWVPSTIYQVNDFVSSGNIFAVCISAHTSGSTFAGDSIRWSYLIDLSSFTIPSGIGQATRFLRENAAETSLEFRTSAQVLAQINDASILAQVTATNTFTARQVMLSLLTGAQADKGADTINTGTLYEAGTSLAAKYAQLAVANTFTAAQTINLTVAGTALSLNSTDAGAAEGPSIFAWRNSATPAASDILSRYQFVGNTSTLAQVAYGSIFVTITDPTNGTHAAQMTLRAQVAGTETAILTLGPGVQAGAPTGGDKGINSINTKAYYQDGVLISPYTAKNAVINGGMEIWQRGAGGAAAIAVAAGSVTQTVDRWTLTAQANEASTVTQVAGLTDGSRFGCRVQRNAAQAGVGIMIFEQAFDSDQIMPLRNNKVALSFTVATGANWSPTNGTISYLVCCGTAAPLKRGGVAYTGESQPITGSVNIAAGNAGTTTVVVSSVVIPTTTTQMCVQVFWTPVGAAGANDWFTIDDVQLEIAVNSLAQASAFERRPFSVDLMTCQRFYQKSFVYGTAPAQNAGLLGGLYMDAITAAATTMRARAYFQTRMRTTPTITTYDPQSASAQARRTGVAAGTAIATEAQLSDMLIALSWTADAGSVAGSPWSVNWQADAEI